jgi:hypothetical protein
VSFRDSDNEADISRLEFIRTNGITGFLLPWKVVDKVSTSSVNTYDRRISNAICTLIPDDSIVRTLMGDAGLEVAMARVVEYWISVEKYEKGSSWLKRLLSK